MPSKTLAPRRTASLLTWMVDSVQGTICPLSQVCLGLVSLIANPLSKPAHPGAVWAAGSEQSLLPTRPGREPHLEGTRPRLQPQPAQGSVDAGRTPRRRQGAPDAGLL